MLDPYDPPRSAHKSPVPFRTSIGPTPQKDGKVLGLFDLLSPASNAGRTPSKQPQSCPNGNRSDDFSTPSKRGLEGGELGSGKVTGRKDLFKSPADSSKRGLFKSLVTPTVRRTSNPPSKSTPCTQRMLEPPTLDETPAFLRRHSQNAHILADNTSYEDGIDYDDQAITWTPVKPRPRPRMAGKGLSALVRGLREMEEEKLDEELDILRELEDGGNAAPAHKSPKVSKPFIPDSQVPDMPLGADGENISSEDDYIEPEKPGRGRAGKDGKTWKKKGQKRTTRQVIMRPVTGTWKPEPKWKASDDSDVEEDEGLVTTVEETQITQNVVAQELLLEGESVTGGSRPGSDIDFEADVRRKARSALRRNDKLKEKAKEGRRYNRNGAPTEKEEVPKVKKKINPTAHANFRALKIKNKNSKAKGGRRFGRR